MNEISIISSDERYAALNGMLLEKGFNSSICTVDTLKNPDILILPIKSTLCDEEFSRIFQNLKRSAFVFCGDCERVRNYFAGRIIDYSKDEAFLDRNAYITAECTISIILGRLKKSLSESKCAVIGYGRIGKHLCKMLMALNCFVTAFARREQSRKEAVENGLDAKEISELLNDDYDIIINTAPSKIISRDTSNKIPKKCIVIDLASMPGGFEDESYPERALALPGKMMPISAGRAIFDFVYEYILNERN